MELKALNVVRKIDPWISPVFIQQLIAYVLQIVYTVVCRGCQPQQLITDNYSGLVHQLVSCVCVSACPSDNCRTYW